MSLSPAVSAPVLTEAVDALIVRLQSAQYVFVAPLAVTRWLTKEPAPFAARESGERAEIRLGEPWARELFDCAWLRFRAALPAGASEEGLVARIDVNGELCVVDADGTPLRGLTNIKSTFDPALGGPGKTVWRLPAGLARDGVVEFWADAGLNDLFGFVKDEGRVALAELARVREDVRALCYDLETLRDWLLAGPGEAFVARLREDLGVVAEELDEADDASVARARERLASWFAPGGAKPLLVVHAVGHAHLDLAWLWPLRETMRKGARTFASVFYNLERYPEYVFGGSQPQLFAWMKEREPALYSKIKDAVRAGRIEPQGTFWVEPDCSMPSGESFVRQVLHGARFFREEFGVVPDYCWQPDVFGYHGQLPQILRKSGHEYFMTQKLSWNAVNRFPHQSFHWEGIDGTRILTHMLPEETYNGPAAARSLKKIAADYAQKDVSDRALMVFGIGDGGGGPDAEHLERLRRAPRLPGMPEVKIGPAADFFREWAKDAARFPVWRGELYLERHQGTLTTQALVKRNNRRAEVALRELEWLAGAAAERAGLAYPGEALDRIWKEILLYQFHDILPGSSIKRVYDECNARYAALLAEIEALAVERASALAGSGDAAVVFNVSGWPRREWIRHRGAWLLAETPALGWCEARAVEPSGVAAGVRSLENEFLRVNFAEDGRIASVFDKRAGRETLSAGEAGNDLVVVADTGDAWDFENNLEAKDVLGYLRRPVARPVLRERTARVDGPNAELRQTWTHGASEIRQTIRLAAGSPHLEFDTEADWREPGAMLRVRFPVDVRAESARFEIPFGHIRRTTRDETSVERAQLEVAALQWADLSDETGRGVALYNDCKHGHRVKGNVLDLALLRSVPHPGAALIGKGDADAAGDGKVYGDLGRHVFRYALRPHGAEADAARLTAEARAFNQSLRVVSGAARPVAVQAGPRPDALAIEIAATKPAEDGDGAIWRLVNLAETAVETRVDHASGEWTECDLREQGDVPVPRDADGLLALRFRAHEIKTLRRC